MIADYKYSDLVEIDKEFQEVFNEDVDKAHKGLWKTFIPHEGFLNLLNVTLKALSRERPGDAKSIWIHGAYGTGKTHAVFVIKHLLEDDEKEVEGYVKTFSNSLTSAIVERIKALRKQGILVVFRSTAGHLNTPLKLLMEVQQAIYNAYVQKMKNEGKNYSITKTEIQHLIEKLESETINWDKLIEKHQNKLFDVANKQDIRRKLEKSDVEFASRFLDVLIEEGIAPIKTAEVDKLKSWIEEIIAQGQISKILFIWDEFSDFFRPEAPLATLQELAHLTQRIPFYLLIVTHRDPEHWIDLISKEVEKLKDRFHRVAYTMESITVYKLISQVIKPKNVNLWNSKVEDIWFFGSKYGIEDEIYRIAEKERNASIKDLKSIVPIHPYTGYIASRIAEWFGSANRTLFKFLKDEDGFLKFLKEYPKDKEFFLTVDYLWEFFFLKNEQELLNTPGIAPLLSYYRENVGKMNDDELRVFRSLMVLYALREKVSEEGLLKPVYSVLKIAFSGTSIYYNLQQILSNLEEKRAIRLMKTLNDIEILKPTHGIDSEELEKIRKTLPKFRDFIRSVDFEEFKVHNRLKILPISAEEVLSGRLPEIPAQPYEIPVYFVLMEKASRLTDLREKLTYLANNKKGAIFLLSYIELGEDWNRLLDNLAYYRYYSEIEKKYEDAKYHEKQKNNIIANWKNKMKWGEFHVFVKFESGLVEDRLINLDKVQDFIERTVDKIYPYSLERYVRKDPLWKNKTLNSKAIEVGLDLRKVDDRKYSALRPFRDLFMERDSIIDEEGNFIESEVQTKRNHPLVAMRETIKSIYEEKENTLNLQEVWKTLQKPPFGLYDCPVGCFAFALLMREYCRGFYAVDVNGIEKELNYDNMAEILNEVIKGRGNWIIQTISKEQKDFCEFLNETFNLDAKSPREVIISLRDRIKRDFRYPIWSLKYIAWEKERTRTEIKEAILLLVELLDDIVKQSVNTSKLEESHKESIKEFSKIIESLDEFEKNSVLKFLRLSGTRFEEGFRNFTEKNFYSKTNSRVPFETVDKILRNRMQEEPFFWKEEKVADFLHKMSLESNFIDKVKTAIDLESYFLEDFRNEFIDKIKSASLLPHWIYEEDKELSSLLGELEKIIFEDRKPFEIDFAKLNEKFAEFEKYSSVLKDLDASLRSWIERNFEELDEPIIEELKEEFKNLISKQPKISKQEALERLKSKLMNIEQRVLRQKITEKLEELTGYTDFAKFLNEKMIPYSLIKYLPNAENYASNLDSVINGLRNLDKMAKEGLRSLLEEIKNNEIIFTTLATEGVNKQILRAFLGKEWYEEIFTDADLMDLITYLNTNLGSAERWTEKAVRETFEKWRLNKYKEVFYPRVKELLDRYTHEDLKRVLNKLIEDPNIGFKFISEKYGEDQGSK